MLAGAAMLTGAFPVDAGASPSQTSPTPSSSVVEGENPTCGELGDFAFEFKIDEQPVEGQTYKDPVTGIEITITNVDDGNPMTFSFTSTIPVSAVFVKAGDGGILYTFDPPTTVGTDLASPKDSISHVSFCWNEVHETTSSAPTTSSTTSSSTTSSSTTSTTVKSTTSTTGGTTSTTGGSTTTMVASVTTTPSGGGGLPRTGSNITPLVALAAGLLAGGVALIAATRRFRNS
jgi:LPXTG-motif cell wall-anchored protein